jgi:hypothetical protein
VILVSAVAVGIVGLAAVGSWWATSRSDSIDYSTVSYVVAPNSVKLTFAVSKAPHSTATCRVTTQDKSAAVNGALDRVVVGPNPDGKRQTTVTVTIPTTGTEAILGQVESCAVTSGQGG